jgi:hypothetical protein
MGNRLLSLLLLVLAAACRTTNPYSHVAALADDGNCEQALSALKPNGGSPYALTASGRPSDVLIAVTGGVAVGVAQRGQPAPADPAASQEDPDFTGLSRAMRGVASCYEGRGDQASLVTSFAQLQQIVESPVYPGAASAEQERVDAQLDLVETRLAGTYPDYIHAVEAKARELEREKARLASQGL